MGDSVNSSNDSNINSSIDAPNQGDIFSLEDNILSSERSVAQLRELMKAAVSNVSENMANDSKQVRFPLIEREPDLDLGDRYDRYLEADEEVTDIYVEAYDEDEYQPAGGIHQKLVAVANKRYMNSSSSPYKYQYVEQTPYDEQDSYIESDSSDDEVVKKVASRLGELENTLDDINSATIKIETALDKVNSACEINHDAINDLSESALETNKRLVKLEKRMNLIQGKLDMIIALLRYQDD